MNKLWDKELVKIAKDLVPGGLADKKKETDFDPEQIAKGIKIEMEHTNDPELAKQISMDHLTENPKYYDYLENMEKEMESDKNTKGIEAIESNFTMNEIHQKIIRFFKDNPKATDKEIHELATKLKINPHEFENHIYMILSQYINR